MASLSVQTLKHLSLEQILDIGFDRLPRNDEFYRAIGRKIGEEELESYYEDQGWSKLEDDLIFLIKNRGKILEYNSSLCIYWEKTSKGYTIISAKAEYNEINILEYITLEATMDVLFGLIFFYPLNPSLGSEQTLSAYEEDDEDDEILEIMYRKKEDLVNDLIQHLESGKAIDIQGPLTHLSIPPFTSIVSGLIILRKDILHVIGTRHDEVEEKEVAFGTLISKRNTNRILAILAYNTDSYEVLT